MKKSAWIQGEMGNKDQGTGKIPVAFDTGVRIWLPAERVIPCEGKVIVDTREYEALRTIARMTSGGTGLTWEEKRRLALNEELYDAYDTLAEIEKERSGA